MMTAEIEKLKVATFKHIEAELYAYNDTKIEIINLRDRIINGTPEEDENDIQGANSVRIPGRPTEQIATRLTTNKQLRNLEEITDAIERAYAIVPEDHKRVIKTRYWSNKHLTWEGIANECNMHRNTALKYRREFVELVAEKVGWR